MDAEQEHAEPHDEQTAGQLTFAAQAERDAQGGEGSSCSEQLAKGPVVRQAGALLRLGFGSWVRGRHERLQGSQRESFPLAVDRDAR